MELHAFHEGVARKIGQEQREQDLDDQRGERLEHVATDLRACQSGGHHNSGQTIVEHVHVLFEGMLRVEVVKEAHSGADKNRETGHSDSRLGVELEESLKHRCGDTAATDSCNHTQRHNKSKDKEAADLEALLREHRLVLTSAAVIAEEVRLRFARFVDTALCIVFQEERLPNL